MDFYQFRASRGEPVDERLEGLAAAVIDAAWEVWRHLGSLLPERCYELALSEELRLRGIPHVCQAPIAIEFKGKAVGEGRIDLLVEDLLIVEIKAVESLVPQHKSQVLSYLKQKRLRLGILINFNANPFKSGIKRVLLDPEFTS